MLQDIRKSSQGMAARIVIGLIVLSFAGFGVQSILVSGGSDGVGEVNGESISLQELQLAINNEKRRLINTNGDSLDPTLLDDERIKPRALEAVVGRKLLMQTAQDMELTVSEKQIGKVIGGMEAFQIDGSFSEERYRNALATAGFSPGQFKDSLRDDIVVNQLRSGLAGSEFVTPTELAVSVRVLAEQRDLRYMTIPRENFTADAAPSEAEIEAYYQEQQSAFLTAETVDLDYLLLTRDDFRQPVGEAAIQEAFELAQDNYQYKTRHRVSHILIEPDGDEPAEDRLARVQAELSAGSSFEEVATSLSEDIGSARTGGDLGYTSGDTFPQEMEDAIAALALGQVSEPVETDAGIHLILVTERDEGEALELDEELRVELEEQLAIEAARDDLLIAVEQLKDLSFNADDLAEPAEELGLVLNQADNIAQGETEGLFAHPALQSAAFSDDVLQAGHNSEVIELANDNYVVMSVRQHHEPEVLPLETVRDQVTAALIESSSQAAVTAAAKQALASLNQGKSIEEFAVSEEYQWQVELGADRRNISLPRDVLVKLFELPVPQGESTTKDFILTSTGDAVVMELVRVREGDVETLQPLDRSQLTQGLMAQTGRLIDGEFQQALREGAEISVR